MPALDAPAHCCYLVVFLIGLLVARGVVEELLPMLPTRWGFGGTWLLFAAHAALPPAMFWVLDATGAVHDTSVVAALVVATGYREIVQGGINSVTMPADTGRLWKPFEKWVSVLAARLAVEGSARQTRIRDWMEETIAADAGAVSKLLVLALEKTPATGRDRLAERVQKLRDAKTPPGVDPTEFTGVQQRSIVGLLVREIQTQCPDTFGSLLVDRGVISNWNYLLRVQDRRSRIVPYSLAALCGLALVLGVRAFYTSPDLQFRYHAWRFSKEDATAKDVHRSRTFLHEHLTPGAGGELSEPARAALARLVDPLGYEEIEPESADDILRLCVDVRCPAADAVVVPGLIEALHTQNQDVRTRIARALRDLQSLDYPDTALPDSLAKWPDADEEPYVDTSRRIGEWESWWREATRAP